MLPHVFFLPSATYEFFFSFSGFLEIELLTLIKLFPNLHMGFLRINSVSSEHIASLTLLFATILYNHLSIFTFFGLLMAAYIAYNYGDFIYRSYLTLNRDLSGLLLLLRVKFDLNRRLRENRGIHEIFLEIVNANLNKTAIIDVHSGRSLTFSEFNELANKFANYFKVNFFKGLL